jgi:mono/diheme cytochrome c family protein
MTIRGVLSALLLVLAGLAAACGGGGNGDEGRSAADEARAIFKRSCARCHGEYGRGDGMMATALRPPPRNYSDPDWQASVTDEYLKEVILQGGGAKGLNPKMPATPELAQNPEVLDALVALIRGFSR